MRTGPRGIALIKAFESLRLKAYRDGGGVLTIGYGHTAAAGAPKPTPGMRITAADAEAILARDLVKYENAVIKTTRFDPTQNQFDAMVSLCFNIGPGAFSRSGVSRAFNAGDLDRAANAFLAWNQDNGRVVRGLVRRRKAERRLFLSQTSAAKWTAAASGGAVAGSGLFSAFGESALSSAGYRLGDMVTWEMLALVGVGVAGLAVVVLASIGHDRRERLWNRLFGGWFA